MTVASFYEGRWGAGGNGPVGFKGGATPKKKTFEREMLIKKNQRRRGAGASEGGHPKKILFVGRCGTKSGKLWGIIQFANDAPPRQKNWKTPIFLYKMETFPQQVTEKCVL